MGSIKETTINRFDSGASEDRRTQSTNKYAVSKHFRAFEFNHKLVPQYKTYSIDNATVKTYEIVKFLYAEWLSAGAYKLFGLGVDPTTTKAKIFSHDVFSGGWGEPAKGESTVTARETKVFFEYKRFIYMWANGTVLMRFDTTGVANFNDSYQSISYDDVAQPVHHPLDDIAYFFSDNKVHKLNDTTWTSDVLTLPDDLIIKSACAYGSYLAIGEVRKGDVNKKIIVYLWDRDSSLSTLSERIDFGEGDLMYLACLNNKLIAIIDYYLTAIDRD